MMVSIRSVLQRRTRRSHRRSRTDRPSAARIWLSERGRLIIAAAYFLILSVLGGTLADWSINYTLICIAVLGFGATAAWRTSGILPDTIPLAGKLALAGIVAIPLLQLVPLPPAFWHALPGQELRRSVLAVAGLADTWQPLSLEPVSTSLVAILAIGFFVLMSLLMRLTELEFRYMLQFAFVVVLLNLALGMAQVVSNGTLLGFFANKNHVALVIACSILLFGFCVSPRLSKRHSRKIIDVGYIAFALICIVTTNSRAGLLFGALASATVLMNLNRGLALKYKVLAIGAVTAVAVIVFSSSAFEIVSARFRDVDNDVRWNILSWSWPLVQKYWELGSGAGSFATLFATTEKLAWVRPTYINAVHNDYIQLVIEFGVPGVVVAVLLFLSILPGIPAALRASRRDAYWPDLAFGLAAILLFIVHSAIDYPLRRPAGWVFLALAIAAVYRGRAASLAGGAGRELYHRGTGGAPA